MRIKKGRYAVGPNVFRHRLEAKREAQEKGSQAPHRGQAVKPQSPAAFAELALHQPLIQRGIQLKNESHQRPDVQRTAKRLGRAVSQREQTRERGFGIDDGVPIRAESAKRH